MHRTGILSEKEQQIILKNVENLREVKRLYGQDVVKKHLKSELKILIEAEEIQKLEWGSHQFIEGKAVLINEAIGAESTVVVPCQISCGSLYKLKNCVRGKVIDLFEHLDRLLPKFTKCIGLVTFQNGIQNNLEDFKKMGKSILAKLPENPLCIGLYNGTNGVGYGIIDDLDRLNDEWHLNTASVIILRQMVATLARLLPFINPEILWLHIAHSEGGLIANEVLTTQCYNLTEQYFGIAGFLKRQLIMASYGSVAPIPNLIHFAINTYSRDDVALCYAKKYLEKHPRPRANDDDSLQEIAQKMYNNPFFAKSQSIDSLYAQLKAGTDQLYIDKYPYESSRRGYTVTIVESRVPKSEQPLIQRDHAFQGATYQNELLENIKTLRERFTIYDFR
jgi:hypothetical protein